MGVFGASIAVLLVCVVTSFSDGAHGIISTSPSGPAYLAATWVRVACRHDHPQPHLLQYRWTGSCNSTVMSAADPVFDIEDPFQDEQGWAVIWVKSTPVECLDHFRCIVYERDGALRTEMASEVFIFQNVSGVGISLPDNIFLGSIPNNSAVVLKQGRSQEVICHSARRSSCTSGQWISATGMEVGSCENQFPEVAFDSLRLNLSAVTEHGIYSCIVYDEMGVEQNLFIGIYQSVPPLTVEQRRHVTTDGLVALECDSRGLPSTATLWSIDGALLASNAADTTVLSDYRATHYRSTLVIPKGLVGVISCDVYSDWVTSDKRNSGRESASGIFAIAPLSTTINLECAFPENTTNIEWLSDLTQSISHSTGRGNTAVMPLTLTEDVHGQTYICRGTDSLGRRLEKHYMALAQVPDGTLSLSIEDPQTEPALNWPFLLQCCASHSNQDIPTQPLLQWYKDGHLLTDNMTSTLGERQSCLSIGFTDLQDDQMGEYTCRASLQSSRMEEMLVKEESFELSVEQETETTTDTNTEEKPTEVLNVTILIIALLTAMSLIVGVALVLLICVKVRSSCKKAGMLDEILEEAGKIVKARKEEEAVISNSETEKDKPATPTT